MRPHKRVERNSHAPRVAWSADEPVRASRPSHGTLTAAATLELTPERLRQLHREYRRSQDADLCRQIVEAHTGLAYRLAQRFSNRGEPVDDLLQVALLGLVKAVQAFDPDRGLRFSTYATP